MLISNSCNTYTVIIYRKLYLKAIFAIAVVIKTSYFAV